MPENPYMYGATYVCTGIYVIIVATTSQFVIEYDSVTRKKNMHVHFRGELTETDLLRGNGRKLLCQKSMFKVLKLTNRHNSSIHTHL